jgi:hypothetical protein
MEEKQQKAFDQTKAAVANSILCTYPNPNKRFILYPDASQKYAMGGVLTQDYTGTELCCGTFSILPKVHRCTAQIYSQRARAFSSDREL